MGGDLDEARRLYLDLVCRSADTRLLALIHNDLGALHASEGDLLAARDSFRTAIDLDPDCGPANANLATLNVDDVTTGSRGPRADARCRIAIVSFLFNWPSTGGGIVHTVELASSLQEAGYAVQHFYLESPAHGVGRVTESLPFESQALVADEPTTAAVTARFRDAVRAFDPDHVIVTDSWNMKPVLADALRERSVVLRFQAMECLCPLNNVRLLPDGHGGVRQCRLHQLARPEACRQCVADLGRMSGTLHRWERELAGVGSPEYHEILMRTMREAAAVLVVNPLQAAMLEPHATDVRVVTAGMDSRRFPWPPPDELVHDGEKHVVFCAALVDDVMKGYAVLHEACAVLWRTRQDFELVVTGDPPGRVDEFTRFTGWLAQSELPAQYYAASVCVVPTIAQEALGRTAVEAMAAGCPVVASRIGGLPFTVAEGVTGLLAEPGDARDLAEKIELLLNDGTLRRRFGRSGRLRFEEHYAWERIIERHYRPLFTARAADARPGVG
jgi:glycosyltransferase involved in cell wall biosynthesis